MVQRMVFMSDLQRVQKGEQILERNGVFTDRHDTEHPGQTQQWKQYHHSLETSSKIKSNYEIKSQSFKLKLQSKVLSRRIIAIEEENLISDRAVKRMNLSMVHLKSQETQ